MKFGRSHLLILVFFLISLIGVFHHELSLDEARPWIIVNETPAMSLVGETRCEMHCLPWFFSLKTLAGIFQSPVAMQIFGIILGTIAFGLLALFSPFTLVEKGLLLVNYYTLFEFNLIARPYTLMTLGLFLVCLTFSDRGLKPGRFLGSLLFLANSTYFGIFLTFPFAGLFLYEVIASRHVLGRKRIVTAVSLSVLYAGCVIWYSLPLSSAYKCVDLSVKNVPVTFLRFAETTWDVARAFFIIGNDTWNEHIFDYESSMQVALSLFWVLSVIGISWGLRKSPKAAFLFMASVFLLYAYRFSKPVYYGSFLRHLGALSLMYVGCMWISIRENSERTLLSRIFFFVFLACGAYSGLRLFYEDFQRPFSSGPEVHRFISESGYRDRKIVPDPILFTSSYLVYSDRKYIDYINGNEARFYPVSESMKPVYAVAAHIRGHHIVPKVREDIFRKAVVDNMNLQPSPLIIISYPTRPGYMEGMGLKQLKTFTGAINPNEDYYIYVRRE